jgi:hypothetical protein
MVTARVVEPAPGVASLDVVAVFGPGITLDESVEAVEVVDVVAVVCVVGVVCVVRVVVVESSVAVGLGVSVTVHPDWQLKKVSGD